jgi:hypothetical protein
MRHDVDDNSDSFDTAVRLAEWEHESGFRSTYYLLHTASYWGPDMLDAARYMESLGHEIGLHVNGITQALERGGDPLDYVALSLDYLRSAGLTVTGCAAHGDKACRYPDGSLRFVNDELFLESPRPEVGEPDRTFSLNGRAVTLRPVSRAEFGLDYDAAWLPKGDYLSDSGNQWSQPFDDVVSRFGSGQLHILQHPDWWPRAFAEELLAA